jgi:hypothetical protein
LSPCGGTIAFLSIESTVLKNRKYTTFVQNIIYMKLIFTFLLLFSFGRLLAQDESTTLRLKSLKTMKDSSLISEKEYEQLKAKVLGLPATGIENNKPATEVRDNRADLKRKYKSQCVAGAVFSAAAIGVGVLAYNKNRQPIIITRDQKGNVNWDQVANDLEIRKESFVRLRAGAIGLGAIAFTCFTLSEINHRKLKRLNGELSLRISPVSFGLCYNFN